MDAQQPSGSIIPVFCTAAVPVQVLDRLIECDSTHTTSDSFRLRFISSAETSREALAKIDSASERPVDPSFTSPFIDKTIEELNDFFIDNIRGLQEFTYTMFIVLDTKAASAATSSSDGECVVVQSSSRKRNANSCGEEKHSGEEGKEEGSDEEGDYEILTLRADFYAARQVLTMVEIGNESLYDGRDPSQLLSGSDIPLEL